MKEKNDEKLGTRELIGIIMVLLILKSTDTTPTLMFRAGYSAGWIIPIISGLLVIIPLLCTISILKAYREKGFIEVLFHLFGKYIGAAAGMVLFYIIFAALFINTRSYTGILSSLYFTRTPVNVLYAGIVIASCYIAYLGIHAIGRTAWIFIPVLQLVTFLIVFVAQKRINLYFIFPAAGSGGIELFKAGLVNVTTWGDIFYLAVIFPMVRGHGEFRRANLIGYSISVIEFVIMMFVYIITFGYPTISYINYPMHALARYVRFGDYFTHPEAFFLGFWIISAVVRFSAQLYFSAVTLGHTLKIKGYRQLLFPLAAGSMALGLLPENFITNVFIIRKELFEWTWPLVLMLPVLMWITGKIRGDL